MVVKKVTWPHELLCTAAGPPAIYEDVSVMLFISMYLVVMETVKPMVKLHMSKHLKELMADAEVYGCNPVRDYHAVWLQQIENGRAKWSNEDAKLEFHRSLVWHTAPPATSDKLAATASPPKKPTKERIATIITAKPGTKASSAFNKDGCTQQDEYPTYLHICV